MKTNLKNRPIANSVFKVKGEFYEVTVDNFEAWAKAFEQELNKMLEYEEKQWHDAKECSDAGNSSVLVNDLMCHSNGRRKILREILGISPVVSKEAKK